MGFSALDASPGKGDLSADMESLVMSRDDAVRTGRLPARGKDPRAGLSHPAPHFGGAQGSWTLTQRGTMMIHERVGGYPRNTGPLAKAQSSRPHFCPLGEKSSSGTT